MADIRINLLPWREELREEKKKDFLKVSGAVVAVAALIMFAINSYYSASIDTQNSRNAFLEKEIAVLEGRIQEIQLLQQKRNELLSRMKVIQELQGNRPILVRIFDELARQLAPRVFFTDVRFSGGDMSVRGVAESNNRISSQLRNFNESDWFANPNVTAINAAPNYGPQASQFTLSVLQTAPKKEEVE